MKTSASQGSATPLDRAIERDDKGVFFLPLGGTGEIYQRHQVRSVLASATGTHRSFVLGDEQLMPRRRHARFAAHAAGFLGFAGTATQDESAHGDRPWDEMAKTIGLALFQDRPFHRKKRGNTARWRSPRCTIGANRRAAPEMPPSRVSQMNGAVRSLRIRTAPGDGARRSDCASSGVCSEPSYNRMRRSRLRTPP